jgi:hypothetical protein
MGYSQNTPRQRGLIDVYEQPLVVDYGDLRTLTGAHGAVGFEDGLAKSVHVGVNVSLAVGP